MGRVGGDRDGRGMTSLSLISWRVICDLMGKFELYGGMFLNWEG